MSKVKQHVLRKNEKKNLGSDLQKEEKYLMRILKIFDVI